MMEDAKNTKIKAEISSESTWTFPGEAAAGSSTTTTYSFTDQESSILSEFGWNLPPEIGGDRIGGADGCFEPFDPFVLEEAGRLRLPDNRPPSGFPAVPSPEVARSGEEIPAVSSSSSVEPPARPPESEGRSAAETPGRAKIKKQKRCRQPRVAFMTKSEVDHLEDGYRWRKYGQKGVKNSPFPRSYYRCTNSKCIVKKRVERCPNDPTIVITTYEGQHCHYSLPTRGCIRTHEPRSSARPFCVPSLQFQPHRPLSQLGHWQPGFSLPPAPTATDEGLLDDILLPRMQN